MHTIRSQTRFFSKPILVAAMVFASAPVFGQVLNQYCVVSILNRTVQVNADGSWILPNVPANLGPVRARATCVQNGVTTFGQSALFTIPSHGTINLPHIQLGNATPVPTSIAVTAPTTTLSSAGATTQLTVTAAYAGGPGQNITLGSTGTQYNISNPAIATISADGLVTAVGTGAAAIQAVNEGAQGLITIHVTLSGVDSDGDGIPDDAEIRLGLNPHDPTDALLDPDKDGLTNLQEYRLGTDIHNPDTDGDGLTDGQEVLIYHTNPLVADTDGDGVPDGLEVLEGTDPLDPKSVNYARAISSIAVQPSTFVLDVNSLNPLASQQLSVIGKLVDGHSTIDLTSTTRGTTYASSDLTICNFGAPDGNVFAGNGGSCTITIKTVVGTVTATGIVRNFTPADLSFLAIPGFANGVDVNGSYAYVAAGASGLQVVSVSDRTKPTIVGSLALPGNADDVRLINNLAFVAAGTGGLHAVDVTNPLAPVLLGTFNTGGTAMDVALRGTTAYIANGSNLVLANVSNPAKMTLISSLAIPGTVRGVDVDSVRKLAAVASSGSVYIVDLSNPAAPVLKGSASTGDARDVVIGGNYAYVADYVNSLTSVDITTPAAPVVRSHITDPNLGGFLQDVVLSGMFALSADVKFVNGIPIADISDPTNLIARSILNFTQRDDNGMGLAADGNFVYLATEHSTLNKFGSTGDSRLYIGQYRPLEDTKGIPPTAAINSPVNGATVIQGSTLPITVNAADDVAVAAVNFQINGTTVFTSTVQPYQFNYLVPTNISTLTLGATAVDLGGNIGTAQNVIVSVIPDPGTTVTGTVVDKNGAPVVGANVTIGALTAVSAANGTFTIAGVPTAPGYITVLASAVIGGRTLRGSSLPTAPVPSGTTNVGNIRLSGGGIGLIYCDSSTTSIHSALVATNLIALTDLTDINACGTTPTLTSLANFSAVFVWSNNAFSDPVALGNVLANFVDQGGGVVLATYCFSSTWQISGRIETAGYSPFAVSTSFQSTSGVLNLAKSNTAHPIMQGVTAASYFENSNYTNPALTAGSVLLAVDTAGNNVVAINATNRVVGVSIYPGFGDMGLLFANALNFVR